MQQGWRALADGTKDFRLIMEEAREVCGQAAALAPADPVPHIIELAVARGLGCSREEFEQLWLKVLDRAPHHMGAHLAALHYWCEKWHGSREQAYAFASGGQECQASVAAIGSGTLMAVEPGKGIIAHRYADGQVRGYVALHKPEEWMRSIDFGDPSAGLRQLADEFDGWSPLLTAFVTQSDAEPLLRPIYALPVGLTWDRGPGVTLVGDAAHLMSPFAGEGANLAMYDGADLASKLVEQPDIEVALTAYEEQLFLRSGDAASRSAQNLEIFFGQEAPQSVVTLFDRS